MAFIHAGCGADKSTADTALPNSPTKASPLKAQSMKIRLKVEDKVMTATLSDSKTTRDFVSLLPLSLTMNDLFRREKFAHPRRRAGHSHCPASPPTRRERCSGSAAIAMRLLYAP